MELPRETIEHEGDTFDISYETFLRCGSCDARWDDSPRTVETGSTGEESGRCPECGRTSGHTIIKYAHYYVKYAAIPLTDPPLEVAPHAEALRQLARTFEAMEANGWNLVSSDGVHLDFEKVETESTDSPHKVSDPLE